MSRVSRGATRWSFRRVRRRGASLLVVVAGLSLAVVPAARASSNGVPSQAVVISPGLPLSGSWPGTSPTVTFSWSSLRFMTHWWRFGQPLRAGDSATLAVDMLGQQNTLSICLIPPVDDYGAADALQNTPGCADSDMPFVNPGQRRRLTLTYRGVTGPAFLVTAAGVDSTDGYSLTVERIVQRVNAGFTVPGRVRRVLSIHAILRYGDNAPVADGVRAALELNAGHGFRRIVTGSSVAGAVRLRARLARSLRGRRVSLRVCTDQPGGSIWRCTAARRVRVR